MTPEQSEAENFNPDYIKTMLDDASKPYMELADHAQLLGLRDYQSRLLTDGRRISNVVGSSYLSKIGSGLIEDQALGYDLAVIQNDYEDAKKQIGAMSVQVTIQDSMIKQLNNEIDTKHDEHINEYKVLGRNFIDSYILHEELYPMGVLEAYIDAELEKHFDTSPINKVDLATTGASAQSVGRVWKAFTENASIRLSRHQKGTTIDGPYIRFLTTDESERWPLDRYKDLDFKSFYDAIRWAEEDATEHGVGCSYLLGRGVGEKSVAKCKQLIELRKK